MYANLTYNITKGLPLAYKIISAIFDIEKPSPY
ncbi:MAG: hypothetical protein BWX96_01739 [Bacteroidetes bacterium ADurb.Bin145]|jgi:hypothetical protein|nr:MAG: hypothetical protein BWX96_01739 [Bacteroidetes bacterium ADurb.Bin145]